MVTIKPFKGIRYNVDKIDDMSTVICPPYDVISPALQKDLYARSPYNGVRLVFGENETGQRYETAAKHLKEWQESETLVRDGQESLYVYSQRFTLDDTQYDRTGIIALLKLVDFGDGLHPHEKTLKGPLVDRMKLAEATQAQFGQIFVIYDDRKLSIDEIMNEKKREEPLFETDTEDGLNHRLWRIDAPEVVTAITGQLQECNLVIADGHHRYTTALRYGQEHPDNPAAGYQMMTFVNSFSEGMIILPTNRLLHGLENVDVPEALSKMSQYFDIEEMERDALIKVLGETPIMVDKAQNLKNHLFGLHCTLTKTSYLLKLKDRTIMDQFTPDETDIYKKLDVNVVHRLIIEEVFGITEKMQREAGMITYVKGNEDTFRQLENPKNQFGLFVRPPLMREVFLTALAGETMPQKATYFYPKIWSGLVINPISD